MKKIDLEEVKKFAHVCVYVYILYMYVCVYVCVCVSTERDPKIKKSVRNLTLILGGVNKTSRIKRADIFSIKSKRILTLKS